MKNLNKKTVILFAIASLFTFDAFSMRNGNSSARQKTLIDAVSKGNVKQIRQNIQKAIDLFTTPYPSTETNACKYKNSNLLHYSIDRSEPSLLKCILKIAGEMLTLDEYFNFVTAKPKNKKRPIITAVDKLLNNTQLKLKKPEKIFVNLIDIVCKKIDKITTIDKQTKNELKYIFLNPKGDCGCTIARKLSEKVNNQLSKVYIKKCFEYLPYKYFVKTFSFVKCEEDKRTPIFDYNRLLDFIKLIIYNEKELTDQKTKDEIIRRIITQANKNLDLNKYISFLKEIVFSYIRKIDDDNLDKSGLRLVILAFFQKLEREKDRNDLDDKTVLKLFHNFIKYENSYECSLLKLAMGLEKENLFELIIKKIFELITNPEDRFDILNEKNNSNGLTILHIACNSKNQSFAKKLIKLNLEYLKNSEYDLKALTEKTKHYLTPLKNAINEKNYDTAVLITKSILDLLDNSISGVKKFIDLLSVQVNILFFLMVENQEYFKKLFEELIKKSKDPKTCVLLLLSQQIHKISNENYKSDLNLLRSAKLQNKGLFGYLEKKYFEYVGDKKVFVQLMCGQYNFDGNKL